MIQDGGEAAETASANLENSAEQLDQATQGAQSAGEPGFGDLVARITDGDMSG